MTEVIVKDSFNRTGALEGSVPDLEFPTDLLESATSSYTEASGLDLGLGWNVALDAGGAITDGSYATTFDLSGFGAVFISFQFLFLDASIFDAIVSFIATNPPGPELFELISTVNNSFNSSEIPGGDFYTGIDFVADPISDNQVSHIVTPSGTNGIGYIKGGIDTSGLSLNSTGEIEGNAQTNGFFALRSIQSARLVRNVPSAPWSTGKTVLQQRYFNSYFYISPDLNVPTWINENLNGPYDPSMAGEFAGVDSPLIVNFFDDSYNVWLGIDELTAAHDSWDNEFSLSYDHSSDILFFDMPGTDPTPVVAQDSAPVLRYLNDFIFNGSLVNVPDTPGATFVSDGWAGTVAPGFGLFGSGPFSVVDSRLRVNNYDLTIQVPGAGGGGGWHVGVPIGNFGGLNYVDFYLMVFSTTFPVK